MRTTAVWHPSRILAFGLSLALAGATAWPPAPVSAAGQVHIGCVAGYRLWIMPTSAQCAGIGTPISWHEYGPRGPRGPAGPAGAKGAKGVKGPKGLRGKPGKNGADGRDGKDGIDGQDGARGATGPRGPQGPMAELVTYSVSASTTGSDGRLMTVSASCDAGDLAIGGGFETDGIVLASMVQGASSPASWQAIALASAEGSSTLKAEAVCADLGPKHRQSGS